MALKFLNKKGWHTGSLRNIENVWKAEQKHEAEQKKLEELRKQIQDERERSEFRLLQEQAGLVPKQERLDFLYESGLAVGKSFNSDAPKAPFDSLSKPTTTTDLPSSSSSTKQQQPSVPGALFEDKPQSANDAWRKLHSDPLLLIKQREQEAVARIKNNPVKMAMIRKSVEAKKHEEKPSDGRKHREKHHVKKSKHKKHSTSKQDSDLEDDASKVKEKRKISNSRSSKYKEYSDSDGELHERDVGRKRSSDKNLKHRDLSHIALSDTWQKNVQTGRLSNNDDDHREKSHVEDRRVSESSKRSRDDRKYHPSSPRKFSDMASGGESRNKHRSNTVKLTEEERAARLKEMQMDAELHEEQRWKRLKQAAEKDAKEATRASLSSGRNFLDDAHKSVYGADKGGSSTIEESVRRRTHYSQRQSEGNAFRR